MEWHKINEAIGLFHHKHNCFMSEREPESSEQKITLLSVLSSLLNETEERR
jgi:hypothetical protein